MLQIIIIIVNFSVVSIFFIISRVGIIYTIFQSLPVIAELIAVKSVSYRLKLEKASSESLDE